MATDGEEIVSIICSGFVVRRAVESSSLNCETCWAVVSMIDTEVTAISAIKRSHSILMCVELIEEVHPYSSPLASSQRINYFVRSCDQQKLAVLIKPTKGYLEALLQIISSLVLFQIL